MTPEVKAIVDGFVTDLEQSTGFDFKREPFYELVGRCMQVPTVSPAAGMPSESVMDNGNMTTILNEIARDFREVTLDKVNPAAVQEWVAIFRRVRAECRAEMEREKEKAFDAARKEKEYVHNGITFTFTDYVYPTYADYRKENAG